MKRIIRRSALGGYVAIAMLLALPVSGLAFKTQQSPSPVSTQKPGATNFVRGAYGKDSSAAGFGVMAANGFNSVMTGPYKELLDPLGTKGLKGVVWLGNFQNGPTCGFDRDDATITKLVKAIAGDPNILAYYLGDEPHVSECPKAPSLFKKRSDLVHSLDPGSTTFTVIQASENGVSHDYAPWAGAVDVIGFDVYPCARGAATCNFGLIDSAAQAIRAAGITRYWAIVQDFQDCYYRLPTPQELATQFDYWSRSDMSGYFVFSWNYQPADPKCVGANLGAHPDNIAQLKNENLRTFTSVSVPAARPPSPGSGSSSIALLQETLIIGAVLACAGAVGVGIRLLRR